MAKGRCFVDKKMCREDCVLFRKGVRYKEDGSKPTPFEECAVNIATDALENIVLRMFGLQAEQTKATNEFSNFTDFFANAVQQSQKRLKE